MRRSFEADNMAPPSRQKVEWRLPMRAGTTIDFILDPRKNHDCDGLFIVDIQIWVDEKLGG